MAKTESVNVTTGEIVEESEAMTLVNSKILKERDVPLYEVLKNTSSLDWKSLTPPQLAVLIMQKPFPVAGGGQLMLTFNQAIIFATRCFELGLSPFSSEVWFDPSRSSVNLTLEGKKMLLRNRGIDVGPPSFENVTRSFDEIPAASDVVAELKKEGYKTDVGVICSMRVGDPKHAEKVNYTAWLSEWRVVRSPVWKAKPVHMLQTRACEKAISLILGTGASDPVD
jgi:hypothetical protein